MSTVHWFSQATGYYGHGSPISKALASVWVKWGNTKWKGVIYHWEVSL